MKKTVLVIPLFIFHAYLNGQSSFNYLEELQKYWNYRYHLTGDKIIHTQIMPYSNDYRYSLGEAGVLVVAKMDALLLQKIEELNLYVLQLQKQNEEQQAAISKLIKKKGYE